MFERFTDRARRSVVLAQEEARTFRHGSIGTEHLLLGLLREGDGVAAKSLAAVGISLEDARASLEQRRGVGAAEPKGHMPFSPRAKKVLELALRQALRLGHNYIGTEHILLALIEEGEGVAAQILIARGDDTLERLEAEIKTQLVMLGVEVSEQGKRMRAAAARARPVSGGPSLGHVSLRGVAAPDEIRKRLEAIEVRLSAIEQLLRRQRGDEEVS